MNDPNKVINVNLSSLLSLKAELLRKQAEVSKAKNLSSVVSSSEEYVVPIKTQKDPTNDQTTTHRKNDKKKRVRELQKTADSSVHEHEDSLLLEKSHKVLEAKAKFYERMSMSGGKLNSDDNCLVMFNKKKQDEGSGYTAQSGKQQETESSGDDTSEDDNYNDNPDDPEDDWVEYTDCLGRTRKCLKRDLGEAKRRDSELAASMPERLDQTKPNWMIDTIGSKNKHTNSDDGNDDMIGPMPPPQSLFGDGLSIMSKHDEQKANWERKEQENLDKPDVHYQDVFFDEARQHGVGYYAFSTDEAERKKQQKELLKAREKTLEEQHRKEALRMQREKIIAERVLAAKNRQRARLGLPPLEKDEETDHKIVDEKLHLTKEERKARKKAEKLERKRKIDEEEREKERQAHVRPWDAEKDGVKSLTQVGEGEEEWQYKPELEPMTQEQWNEYKRNERTAEFAPLPEKHPKRTNFRSTPHTFYNNVPPPTELFEEPASAFSMYQSSKKKQKAFKRRNFEEPRENEDDSVDTAKAGVCIPPPSNLEDFYLPSNSKRTKSTHDVETSIEAGLRFIRNNCKKLPATKNSWTAKADY